MNPLKAVTLEMSLKPFRNGFSPEAVEEVCQELFRQWDALLRHAPETGILLWASDGSEILEYSGHLDEEMEWARYIGGANRSSTFEHDPEGVSLHACCHLYCPDPPTLTYRGLACVVDTLRRVGEARTGNPVRVGATFDPGPEFARSRFKYDWHNEICMANTMGQGTFACCYARLHADKRRYAAFPEGIPEGLPLGTFLGRQARVFLRDMGFDTLWLSNGFGFGMETWGQTGAVFDGAKFDPARRGECGDRNLEFWRLLRAELPDVPIEVRGTNLSTGLDVGSDGVPFRDIYDGGFGIPVPPNSPWAAINQDFGMELAGWMSHVAVLPSDNPAFPFRFYAQDPWWLSSPWLDRYERQPHDIYLPGAVCRLDDDGCARIPDRINILTIDDSLGRMPAQVPNEVIPHLLEARHTGPDRAGPLIWAYPFDEIHDRAFGPEAAVEEAWVNDWIVRSAINEGLPLNTVISTSALIPLMERRAPSIEGRLLVTPVPGRGSPMETAIPAWVERGGAALLYGTTRHAGQPILDSLGLQHGDALSGEMDLHLLMDDDQCQQGSSPARVMHPSVPNGGGCLEVPAGMQPLAEVSMQGEKRVIAGCGPAQDARKGCLLWVRGGLSIKKIAGGRVVDQDRGKYFPQERLLRMVLSEWGWDLATIRETPAQPGHSLTIHRHDNGWYFSGLSRSTATALSLRCPDGAPLLTGQETLLRNGKALYHLPRAWRHECRVFVDQSDDAELSCVETVLTRTGFSRCQLITGLRDAKVTLYPGMGHNAHILLNPKSPCVTGEPFEKEVLDNGLRVICHHITGSLRVMW